MQIHKNGKINVIKDAKRNFLSAKKDAQRKSVMSSKNLNVIDIKLLRKGLFQIFVSDGIMAAKNVMPKMESKALVKRKSA